MNQKNFYIFIPNIKSFKMETVKDVMESLSEVDSINMGGCGISALSMYRWLVKNEKLCGDEHFVFLYSNSSSTFKTNDDFLKNKSGVISSASHVGLFHNKQLFDCDGIIFKRDFVRFHENITEDVLVKSINNWDQWNYAFDRKRGITRIQKKLQISLIDLIK